MMMLLCDGARGQYEKKILKLVEVERDRQQRKWGIQTHSIPEWMTILGEEFGEACKAGLETEYREASLEGLEKELIQTMAVALAILEGIGIVHKLCSVCGGETVLLPALPARLGFPGIPERQVCIDPTCGHEMLVTK
jgi:hypothetical protein